MNFKQIHLKRLVIKSLANDAPLWLKNNHKGLFPSFHVCVLWIYIKMMFLYSDVSMSSTNTFSYTLHIYYFILLGDKSTSENSMIYILPDPLLGKCLISLVVQYKETLCTNIILLLQHY